VAGPRQSLCWCQFPDADGVELEEICKEVDVTDEVKIKQDNDKADGTGRHKEERQQISSSCIYFLSTPCRREKAGKQTTNVPN
jgi:hypothetical protein